MDHLKFECKVTVEEICVSCGTAGHKKENCTNSSWCISCHGNHCVLQKGKCEIYQKAKRTRINEAVDRLTGILDFTKQKYNKKSYAEAASYTKDFKTQEKELDRKFANKEEVNLCLKTVNESVLMAQTCLSRSDENMNVAKDLLTMVQKQMQHVAKVESDAVYTEMATEVNKALSVQYKVHSKLNNRVTKLELLMEQAFGDNFPQAEKSIEQQVNSNKILLGGKENFFIAARCDLKGSSSNQCS